MKRLRGYLDHDLLELNNNTAERSMRGIAIGRKNYMFVGSERGGKSAAIIYTLIETAKLNNIDPQTWLTDVLSRISDHKINRIDELLPWNYKGRRGAYQIVASDPDKKWNITMLNYAPIDEFTCYHEWDITTLGLNIIILNSTANAIELQATPPVLRFDGLGRVGEITAIAKRNALRWSAGFHVQVH